MVQIPGPLYILSFLKLIIKTHFSSLYTYAWDIKMDWGLFDKNSGENKFLREEIVYSSKRYYYFAIVEDAVLRYLYCD